MIRTLKEPGTNFSTDFIYDEKKGWFNRYLNEVRPELLKMDLNGYPRAKEVFEKFEVLLRDK